MFIDMKEVVRWKKKQRCILKSKIFLDYVAKYQLLIHLCRVKGRNT